MSQNLCQLFSTQKFSDVAPKMILIFPIYPTFPRNTSSQCDKRILSKFANPFYKTSTGLNCMPQEFRLCLKCNPRLKDIHRIHRLKWKQYYLSHQSWQSQNIYGVWIWRSWWVWYLKRDHSSQLVLLLQAKVPIAGNSNIINILRMSTSKRQVISFQFQQLDTR